MRRPGFALPSVLWLVVAIGVFAAFVMVRSRVDLARIEAAETTARARAAVEGAIEEAAFRLLAPQFRIGLGTDAEYVTDIGGIPVTVSIADVDGLVDVNGAPLDLLQIAGHAAGLPADIVPTLASRIVDFRDSDAFSLPNGAEDPDYAAANLPAQSKDAPFDSVTELQQVLGVDETVYRALFPFVTVHGGRAQIDPSKAPERLRQAIGSQGGIVVWSGQSRQQIYRITARAALRNGSFGRQATVRLSRSLGEPISWLGWLALP